MTGNPETFEAEFFNQAAGQYDNIILSTRYQLPGWIRQNSDQIFSQHHLTYIDIGCGSGWLGGLAREYQPDACIYGLDFSEEMLRVAGKTGAYRALARSGLSSGEIPIAENGFFDLLITTGITAFVSDPELFISETRRMLREGGKAVFSFEKRDPTGFLDANRKMKMRSFTLNEIQKLLRQNDFKILEMTELAAYQVPGTTHQVENYFTLAIQQNGQQ